MWIETISGQSQGGENRVNKRGVGHFIGYSSCLRTKRPKQNGDLLFWKSHLCKKKVREKSGWALVNLAALSIMHQLMAQPAKTVMKVRTIIQSRASFIIHNTEQ